MSFLVNMEICLCVLSFLVFRGKKTPAVWWTGVSPSPHMMFRRSKVGFSSACSSVHSQMSHFHPAGRLEIFAHLRSQILWQQVDGAASSSPDPFSFFFTKLKLLNNQRNDLNLSKRLKMREDLKVFSILLRALLLWQINKKWGVSLHSVADCFWLHAASFWKPFKQMPEVNSWPAAAARRN